MGRETSHGGENLLVNCKCHGKKIDRETAYKVTSNQKNFYYCSENDYRKMQTLQKEKNLLFECVNLIFGYKVINSALFKEIAEIEKSYNHKLIREYMQANKDYLSKVMQKDFVSEYAKIRYFSAIIKNSISDYAKAQKKKVIKTTDIEFYEQNYKPQPRRKSLSEYEEG